MDIAVGKRIEWCVCKFFNNRCEQCSLPDFRVFGAGEKSYDFDFVTNSFNVHVKGQGSDSANMYGLSWTFGCRKGSGVDTDHHIFNPDLSRDVIFFGMNDGNECVLLSGCFVKTLHDKNLFQYPTKEKFWDIKKNVYFEDIVDSMNGQQWEIKQYL